MQKFGLTWLVMKFIQSYQYILSPVLGGQCRFYPSCSDYALACFSYYSFSKAFAKSFLRILRCQPLSKGYIDEPFPEFEKFVKQHKKP